MINKITLTNFKAHRSLVVEFQEGLVGLKGANEAGKSTIYEAIAYAHGGARALKDSLEETVTYDCPASSLKVKCEELFEGVPLVIERSKSGAKLTYGSVTVNGQSEVTKYVEQLYGCNMDTASKIMIASQNKLRGALETGEAVALIENLANISIIDDYIKKIQAQLPCGSTKSLADNIANFGELVPPIKDTTAAEADLAVAKADLALVETKLSTLDPGDLTLSDKELSAKLGESLANNKLLDTTLTAINAAIAQLAKLAAPLPLKDVSELRTRRETQMQELLASVAYSRYLTGCDSKPLVVDAAAIAAIDSAKKSALAAVAKLNRDIAHNSALLITESACGLCGKDLTDVPEVVEKNKASRAKVGEAEKELINQQAVVDNMTERHTQCVADVQAVALLQQLHAELSLDTELVEVDGRLHLQWVPPVPEQPDTTDYLKLMREADAYNATQTLAASARERWETELAVLNGQVDKLVRVPDAVLEDIESQIKQREVYRETHSSLCKALDKATYRVQAAATALRVVENTYLTDLQAYVKAAALKEHMQAALADMQSNNALIAKLREVRPIIATRLWSVVLGSVSTYFSQIRGTPSMVTRSDSGFKVNGRPAGGVSGSTLDSLGLAMRMALGKTFLPSVDFLLLDEPAAGMDDNREAAMLGLLAAVDYKQVIVVTHSNLADSFADSIVTI